MVSAFFSFLLLMHRAVAQIASRAIDRSRRDSAEPIDDYEFTTAIVILQKLRAAIQRSCFWNFTEQSQTLLQLRVAPEDGVTLCDDRINVGIEAPSSVVIGGTTWIDLTFICLTYFVVSLDGHLSPSRDAASASFAIWMR